MSERKIFNFDSIILEKETFDKFGYYPNSLGNSSAKFIIAICRFCGKGMEVRKGFFNKSGSACHKECKLKEMSLCGSPFLLDETREKAKNTNLKKWGNECPQKTEFIRNKISKSKKDPDYQQKFKKTMELRYGVDNPAKMSDYAEKVKNTSLIKYKKEHFNLSEEVQLKRKNTSIKKYGCDFPTQNSEIKEKIKDSWKEIISQNDEKYFIFNLVSNSKELWYDIEKGMSLSDVSKKYNVDRIALNKVLLSEQFKNKYQKTYTYPKHQKQKEIYEYLKSIGVSDLIIDDKNTIGLELDIYSPTKKIAIEFNGSYWHSEAILDPYIARTKHINKTKMCKRIGIRLINIFEKQWEDRRFQYESFLSSAFGLNSHYLNGRSCLIDFNPEYEFMEKYHIQGKPRGVEFWVNLKHNFETVGSISLSSHHRQNSSFKEAVLSRMVFKKGVTVRGGASKMLSYAIKWAKVNNFDSIITWSDEMITNGNVYEKMGFYLDKTYGPDYFYWDLNKNEYRSKQSQKKSATGCPRDVTERDWCYDHNLYRIWDCGKKRWKIDF